MMYVGKNPVFLEIHKEYIKKLCGKNVEFFSIIPVSS